MGGNIFFAGTAKAAVQESLWWWPAAFLARKLVIFGELLDRACKETFISFPRGKGNLSFFVLLVFSEILVRSAKTKKQLLGRCNFAIGIIYES